MSGKTRINPYESGKRLRELRGIRTKVGVSNELGIPYSTYCSYESGTRCPPESVREKLARYYEVPVTYIFYANE